MGPRKSPVLSYGGSRRCLKACLRRLLVGNNSQHGQALTLWPFIALLSVGATLVFRKSFWNFSYSQVFIELQIPNLIYGLIRLLSFRVLGLPNICFYMLRTLLFFGCRGWKVNISAFPYYMSCHIDSAWIQIFYLWSVARTYMSWGYWSKNCGLLRISWEAFSRNGTFYRGGTPCHARA